MDPDTIVKAFQTIFEIATNSSGPVILAGVGLLLLVLAVGMAVRALKADPNQTPLWLKVGLFGCLVGGVGLSIAGPYLAILKFSEYPIVRVSSEKAFDNLEKNERVHWLIRLIPYDAQNQPDLSIARLKKLGPPDQSYTFVAAHEELVGYGVDEAAHMTGGTYYSGQRVSAIIFPVAGRQLIPANARGLLQVIQNIENDGSNKIDIPFLKGSKLLDQDELTDLKLADALTYWRWQNYRAKYPHYCELAQTFRCDPNFSARKYISDLNIDWHPLGLAQKDVEQDSCTLPTRTYCSAPSNWKDAEKSIGRHFGSRVFLIKNLEIESIANRVLIDFGDPTHQYIPDIGFRATRQ